MDKKVIRTERAPAPIGPYSQAVQFGNLLFTSGQIAIDPSSGKLETSDLETETHLVLKNISAILEQAGIDMSHIIKSSIFLSDMNNFSRINEIYGAYFKDHPPARETVEVSRLPKDVNVEISVIEHL